MFCANCGSRLEDGDSFCPNCGWHVTDEIGNGNEPQQRPMVPDTSVMDTGMVPDVSGMNTGIAIPPIANPYAGIGYDSASDTGKKGGFSKFTGTFQKGNGGDKKWLRILIPVVAVVAVAAVLICNAAYVHHFVRRTFSSPEKYYQYIEKKEVEDTAGTVAALYDNLLRSSLDISDKSVTGSVKVELSDDVCDMLSEAADLDLDWVKSLELRYDGVAKNKDSMFGANAELFLGKNSAVSGKVLVDGGDKMLYMQVPELTTTYLALDMGDALDFDSYEELLEMTGEIYEKTPDKKEMEKMLNRYFSRAIECIDDVDKDKDVLEAEGVSKKYLALTAEIDSDTMQAMVEAVLEEMLEDEQLEDLVKELSPLLEEALDGEDLYEAFEDALNEALDNADMIGDSNAEFTMTIWVDGKGTIRGRSIEADGMKIFYAMPQKGSKFGLEAGAETEDGTFVLSGEGKRSGSKLSGDFKVKCIGMKFADIEVKNFDTDKIKEGYLSGEFTVKPSSKLGAGGTAAAILSDYSYKLAVENAKDTTDIKMSVLDEDESLGSVSISSKTGSGGKLSVPSDEDVIEVEDYFDMMEWIDEIDWDEFFDHLHDAGVPSDMVDDLEDAVDNLF